MVRFNGVNHLAMAAGDMAKAIRFWREVKRTTPVLERIAYAGAGSELFHGKKV